MDTEKMRKALGDRNLKIVARDSGLGHNTLVRFRKGQTMPRPGTLRMLADYLGIAE